MYGVKSSQWLTGAVGPQAVSGRHSSTLPVVAGGRLGARIVSDSPNYHHTGPDCTSIGEFKNMVPYQLSFAVLCYGYIYGVFYLFWQVLKI